MIPVFFCNIKNLCLLSQKFPLGFTWFQSTDITLTGVEQQKYTHPTICPLIPETPMLDDGEEGGVKLWHLVKASEESELPKHRRGSLRERGGERAKAIPEIYLTRLLSMKVNREAENGHSVMVVFTHI